MDAFLTPADVAKTLGVTPAAVRQMARRGDLVVAARTLRGGRLFRRADVEALKQRRRHAERSRG